MEENKKVAPAKGKKKGWLIILLAVIALLAVIGGIFAFFYLKDRNSDAVSLEEDIKAQLGQLEDKTSEEIEEALNQVVEKGSLNISINMNPVFSNGEAAGSLKIENGPANLYNVRVTIKLDQSGEEVYHSGLMPIDSHIQEDKLEVVLDKGEYDATAVFTAYDVDTDKEIGSVMAQITLSVLG